MNEKKFQIIRNLLSFSIVIFLLVGILGFFWWHRKKSNPIIIGFSSQLTGTQAELGVQERNGAQLAIETINTLGGIDGRKISLIVNNDLGIPENAQSGDEELIKEGAVAIIGHATTGQTLAGLKATNNAGVVMISPTTSTCELSGIDDYFIRVYPALKDGSENFSKYIYEQKNIKRMAIIYDTDNLGYSGNYTKIFSDKFKSLGGNITDEANFYSGYQPDFTPILAKLFDTKPDGLFIVASDRDTALIAQRVRLMGSDIPMYSSAWAQTDKLISIGGKAVEGMEIEQPYDLNNESLTFNDFKLRYKSRFGNEPTFSAIYSYEAALVLTDALKRTNGSKEGLKQALLETNNYNGLVGTFSIDKYGDAKRNWFISTVDNGKFVMNNKLTSTDYEVNK